MEGFADDPRIEVPASSEQTVLIIDDEFLIRLLIGEVVCDLGYTVLEADTGPAGLEILYSAKRIDLLISDLSLPGGLSGRQVAEAARVYRPDLRVLFITGYAEDAAIGNGVLYADMDVMTKPFSLEALAAKIKTLMP
jgi:CheY-like chemotaxis protein